jgi:hypothetical protein
MPLKAGMLLKTHVEKMSVLCLSTMLMKTHKLDVSLHDVHEKKGGYQKTANDISPLRGGRTCILFKLRQYQTKGESCFSGVFF